MPPNELSGLTDLITQSRLSVVALNGILAALNNLNAASLSTKPGGTSGQIQYNNGGAFGGLSVVPLANGGTGGTGANNTQTASYTFQLGDVGNTVVVNSASAIPATVPNSSTAAFPVGTYLNVLQTGVGAASLVPAAGVTILYRSTLNLNGINSLAELLYLGNNVWKAFGELA